MAVIANDVDRLPGSPGQVDRLITVGPAGLSESWLSATTGSIVTSLVDGSDEWLDARFVRVNDIDGDGDNDIVGVHRDGSLVLSKLRRLKHMGDRARLHDHGNRPRDGTARLVPNITGESALEVAVTTSSGSCCMRLEVQRSSR